MVKLSAKGGISAKDMATKTVVANLFADTKEDVTDNMEIVGMLEGYTLGAESSVMTASGEVAFMKSDGTWNWL